MPVAWTVGYNTIFTGDGDRYHYGSYSDNKDWAEFDEKKMLPAASSTPPRVSRPTPNFATVVKPMPELVKDPKVDNTIPWAELSNELPEAERSLAEVARGGAGSHLHIHVSGRRPGVSHSHHHHHHHHSPQPAPLCQLPSPRTLCCPAAPHHQPTPNCMARCGISQDPAMCGTGILMFQQSDYEEENCVTVKIGSPHCHDS